MRGLLLLAALPSLASSHGQLVNPRPRNSLDYLVGVNDPDNRTCANMTGDACANGQAAFWYSQGCFIGCDACDHASGRVQTDLCGAGARGVVSTNNGAGRSLNLGATPGAADDIYRHNPWRAPGLAPVADACGLAGGTPWGADAAEEGVYTNTSLARHGMAGSTLPRMPTGAVWTLGARARVSWNVRNNHGGGYQYRLCPADAPLTEACFQKTPLVGSYS